MLKEIYDYRKQGLTIGFTASTADLLHPGFLAVLGELKSKCDIVIVGLLDDPTKDRDSKNAPVQTIFERWIQLASVSYVDHIVPFDTEQDLEDMLYFLKPDIRFVGEEYKDTEFTGKNIEGIEIYYNKREHSFSSTDLRARVYDAERNKNG